jgi:hypothetical protein
MVSLCDLPPELLIRIFLDLNVLDLVSCQLTHSLLCTIIRESVILSYRKALHIAGAEDNPNSKLTTSERLDLLNAREDAWRNIHFDFRQTIDVTHNPSGIYDLTGGVYLLGDYSRHALHYLKLPEEPSDVPKWSHVDVDHQWHTRIIDMAFAIYEHDLIAIVTSFVHHFYINYIFLS